MRIVPVIIASGGLGLACLALLGGCGDESKTTGTQLQLTPADQAALDDIRGAMKGRSVARKQERVQDRKDRQALKAQKKRK